MKDQTDLAKNPEQEVDINVTVTPTLDDIVDSFRYAFNQAIQESAKLSPWLHPLCFHNWKEHKGLNAICSDYQGIGQAYTKCSHCGVVK